MERRTVLVTGVGGDIGQSLLKCVKDSGYRFKLIGIDNDPFAAGREEVKKFFNAPMARQKDKYSEFIRDLVKTEKIEYIFPATEPEIEFYHQERKYFEQKKVILFINNPFIIETFMDKLKTVDFLKKNGFLYPESYPLEFYDRQLTFPLLLKPRKSCGGKGIVFIEDREALTFYQKRLKGYIAQEIIGIPQEEYTVGVFSDKKSTYSIVFKRILGYGSLTKIGQLFRDKEIDSLAEEISKKTDLAGTLNLQLRKTDKGYVVIEINPRFSSTLYFRHYFGFQDVKWWIDFKENRLIRYKLKYKRGVAVRKLDEVFFDLTRA